MREETGRKVDDLRFNRVRQTGIDPWWVHGYGRATTIPNPGGRDMGPPLLYRILERPGFKLGIFEGLR